MKRLRRGFPFWELFTVWIIVLCTALPISSLFPFLYFMIDDFNIAKKEEDIGFYAGFVGEFVSSFGSLHQIIVFQTHIVWVCVPFGGCSFMLGRAFTSVAWGLVADRYGRKPVILIGTASVLVTLVFISSVSHCLLFYFLYPNALKILCYRVVFNTLFGLSLNFWMAIITRFCLGSFNGLLGPIKVIFSFLAFYILILSIS
jgi:MFS family permease